MLHCITVTCSTHQGNARNVGGEHEGIPIHLSSTRQQCRAHLHSRSFVLWLYPCRSMVSVMCWRTGSTCTQLRQQSHTPGAIIRKQVCAKAIASLNARRKGKQLQQCRRRNQMNAFNHVTITRKIAPHHSQDRSTSLARSLHITLTGMHITSRHARNHTPGNL